MAFFASGILSLQAKAYELSVCCLAPSVLAALYRPAARPLLSVMLGAVGVLAGFPLVGLGLATVSVILPKRRTVLSME
ncbi:MAG: hypothetical protein JSR80_00575 [Verrucomicrobia bacterium]|nr:hypothetical protein [Verrucomicrobiota bacterium]